MRVLILLLLSAFLLCGETFKLYLKDGSFHMTREYKRAGDRISYFSTERGEYESSLCCGPWSRPGSSSVIRYWNSCASLSRRPRGPSRCSGPLK